MATLQTGSGNICAERALMTAKNPTNASKGAPGAMNPRKRVFNAPSLPWTRWTLRAATLSVLGCTLSFGSCGMLVGGLHGLVIAAAISGLVAAVSGFIAVGLALAADAARSAATAVQLWPASVEVEVEVGAAQLSLAPEEGEAGDGGTSLVP